MTAATEPNPANGGKTMLKTQARRLIPLIDLTNGTCCACGGHADLATFLMLPFRAPVPGTGWGCVVCGLPPDGAIAAICDECAGPIASTRQAPGLKYVCLGRPLAGRVTPYSPDSGWFRKPFTHDLSRHEGEQT